MPPQDQETLVPNQRFETHPYGRTKIELSEIFPLGPITREIIEDNYSLATPLKPEKKGKKRNASLKLYQDKIYWFLKKPVFYSFGYSGNKIKKQRYLCVHRALKVEYPLRKLILFDIFILNIELIFHQATILTFG